ncbi:unnamed protein product [Peronospora destructor]|uniref:Uncharacterized protein n=1 Tax=Peronospora destructor TaxID=86335 RepID=A0AAV0VAF2_9STRA|nr:unnamed protein product [Peronospora destructor]
MSSAEGSVRSSEALPSPGKQGVHVQWEHVPGPPVERGRVAGDGGAMPLRSGDVGEVRSGHGTGRTVQDAPLTRRLVGFRERDGPGERNGPGDLNDPGEHNDPGSRNASADAGADATHDRSVVLVRTAIGQWIAKADDDLRPMIPLEEEALAAWMMGGIVLTSPPGFLIGSAFDVECV